MNDLLHLYIQKPGLQTLIQDLGRLNYRAFGVPVNGAMDQTSAKIANELVDNPPGSPVLEITLIGPQISFSHDCQIALTGADLSARIDRQPTRRYETINVNAGATLSFGKALEGCRAYLAVRGEWKIQTWLGSSSASAHQCRELTPDSCLQKDSRLSIQLRPPIAQKIYPEALRPSFPSCIRVRVLPGPEFEAFSPYAIGYFFSRGYRLTADSNRMGYRLNANIIDFRPDREVISSGIIPGAIQVTNSGQPIILMVDAQTTGGYFRLANVITADMDRLAQLKPGDEVWFSLVRLEEAYEALKNLHYCE